MWHGRETDDLRLPTWPVRLDPIDTVEVPIDGVMRRLRLTSYRQRSRSVPFRPLRQQRNAHNLLVLAGRPQPGLRQLHKPVCLIISVSQVPGGVLVRAYGMLPRIASYQLDLAPAMVGTGRAPAARVC